MVGAKPETLAVEASEQSTFVLVLIFKKSLTEFQSWKKKVWQSSNLNCFTKLREVRCMEWWPTQHFRQRPKSKKKITNQLHIAQKQNQYDLYVMPCTQNINTCVTKLKVKYTNLLFFKAGLFNWANMRTYICSSTLLWSVPSMPITCKIYNLNVVNGWKLISLALQPFALNVLQVCLQYCIISHITIYMCNTCCRQNKQPNPTCHVLTIKHRSNLNLTSLLYSQAGFASSIISEMISIVASTFSRGMLY